MDSAHTASGVTFPYSSNLFKNGAANAFLCEVERDHGGHVPISSSFCLPFQQPDLQNSTPGGYV